MGKIFYLDCETTGTDPQRHCLVQLAYLIEIDGEVKEDGNLMVRPHDGAEIEQEALDIHGRTVAEIMEYPSIGSVHGQLVSTLAKYVNKYDKTDKFVPAGYFVQFDTGMLRAFFRACGDNYYGSWFTSVGIDVSTFVALEICNGERFPNHKLDTVCQRYGVEIQAHDALSDIKATRELFLKLSSHDCKVLS